MDDFNLRSLVREVLGGTTMTDPTQIAREVDRRISEDDCRDALRQALRGYVREEITRMRRHHDVEEPVAQATLVSNVTPMASGGAGGPSAPVRTVKPVRSAKVAGIREWWSSKLLEPYHVGEKVYRRLGDCSFEDLLFAAAERREHAARNAARAEWFEQLAETVRAAGVSRVRDLSTDVLQARLGDVAA
ncbi:hypothetical protein [Streptomyces sp. CB03911]|uniref:hypothetical protein n=1 Tax=Streptomyces sp. CB03911 TaxID=1804758 RepID=UPI00093EB13A|nr:hypothetical protein [Streptomyces sp. CB03911]OKI16542.1 hypothetical protein A6A07_11060 [Streptomyces sp. CB03911]